MWAGSGGDGNDTTDQNRQQHPILLLDPQSIPSSFKNKNNDCGKTNISPNESFLGGHPVYFADDDHHNHNHSDGNDDTATTTTPKCERCRRSMYLILQMYAPLPKIERTLYVFSCNQASCIQSSFLPSSLSSSSTCCDGDVDSVDGSSRRFNLGGGGGVIRCIRSQCVSDGGEGDASKQQQPQKQHQRKDDHSSRKNNTVASTASIWGGGGDESGGGSGQATDITSYDGGWGDVDDDEGDGDANDWGDIDTSAKDDDANNDDDNNDDDDDDESMDDLEAMLAAMEAKEERQADIVIPNTKKTKSKRTKSRTAPTTTTTTTNQQRLPNIHTNGQSPAFARHILDVYNEPPPPPKSTRYGKMLSIDNQPTANSNVDDDDSDVDEDIGVANKDDAMVKRMLSRYMEEEDDEEILVALGGGGGGGINAGTTGGSSGGGGGGEKYERLSPENRAFLAFTDRMRRAPYQAVRYAYGGKAMWSIPTPLTTQIILPSKKRGNKKKKKGGQCRDTKFPIVPPCPCGSQRAFEFQLMPSILHTLDVDQYSLDDNNEEEDDTKMTTPCTEKQKQQQQQGETIEGRKQRDSLEWVMRKDRGGMNWGVVAVYSCAMSCDKFREEFVVLQESTDGEPKKVIPTVVPDASMVDKEDQGGF